MSPREQWYMAWRMCRLGRYVDFPYPRVRGRLGDAVEYARTARDPFNRTPGRILRMLWVKRNPVMREPTYNCRCHPIPITR